MRYATLFLLAFAFVLAGCATTLPPGTEYQEVRQVEGVKADEVYERSLNWMAETFVSANDAIQVRDDENNRLVANASMMIPGSGVTADMSIIVEARDGRFRLTARNFGARLGSMQSNMTKGFYQDLKPELKRRASDLQSYILGETKDTDW